MKSANKMIKELAMYQHILLGIKLRIWDCAYSTDKVESALFRVWLDNSLMDANGELTELANHYIRSYDFMQYELNVAYANSTQAHPKTEPANYEILRRALGSTFLSNIRPLFLESIHYSIFDGMNILDYAGGSGEYGITLMNCFSHADCKLNIRLMDRHPQCKDKRITSVSGDIIKDRHWMVSYINHYDVILANEIIHCLSGEDAAIALHDMWYMLKKDGVMIVGEQVPTERMNVRMAAYTNGRMYKQKEMIKRIEGLGEFKLKDINENSVHYFLTFEAIR